LKVSAMASSRRISTYVGIALLGGVVGAVVGVLMAPGPGDQIRRRLVSRPIDDQETLLRRAEMAYELLADELDLPANA